MAGCPGMEHAGSKSIRSMTLRSCSRGHFIPPVDGVCPECKRIAEERNFEKEPPREELELDNRDLQDILKVK